MPTITAVCPQCDSQYQVDAALAGKHMRCPNAICRAVFEVKDPAALPVPVAPAEPTPVVEKPALPPARPGQQSGNVSDFLPILQAEAVAPAPPAPAAPAEKVREKPKPVPRPAPVEKKPELPPAAEKAPEVPSWESAPPPVRGEAVAVLPEAPPRVEEKEAGLDFSELEGESETETLEQPPQPAVAAATPDPLAPQEGLLAPSPAEPARRSRRRSLAVMILMGIVLAGLGVGALYLIQGKKASDEADRFQVALKAYESKDYAKAVLLLQALTRDFPDSSHRKEYRVLAELSDLRASVHRGGADAAEATRSLDRTIQFLDLHKKEPFVVERYPDLWLTLVHLAKDLVTLANVKQDDKLFAPAHRAIQEAGKLTPPAGKSHPKENDFIEEQIAVIGKGIAEDRFRKESLALLEEIAKSPSAQAVEAARDLIEARSLLKDDKARPEAQAILAKLKAVRLESVRFIRAKESSPPKVVAPEPFWNLALAPVTREILAPAPEDGPPLLALARGVLYALEPRFGEVRWARRLGVDTPHLPLRVAATLAHPDFLVAVATDPPQVIALSHADGRELWRHPLPAPSVCRPIRVDGQLLIPMLSGRVDEIDLLTGKHQGSYEIGQALLAGGVHQPGTSLVYLPAAQSCLYVLDASKRECVQIHYLRHAAGAIPGPPLVLTEPAPEGGEGKKPGKSWLLLSKAKGQTTQLLRYALPLNDAEAEPVETIPLPAAHSFPPRRQGDRLAIAGDDGSLTLFGIRTRSAGPLLYPYLSEASVHTAPGAPTAPALLAHADSERWWVLAKGQLYHYHLALSPEEGLKLLSLWSERPLRHLGSPLHPAEVRRGPGGDTVLFLTTQAQNEPTCLASAVDAATGLIRWQRQLGAISQSPPRVAGTKVLLHDARGVLSLSLPAESSPARWSALEPETSAKIGPQDESFWLPGDAGPLLLTWARPTSEEGKTTLHVHTWIKGKHQDRPFALPSPPHGTPTRHQDSLILPLADGKLHQIDLSTEKATPLRPWRGDGVDQKLPGHAVSLGDAGLVVTDGNLTVTLLQWLTPDAPPTPTASKKLLYRITAPPVAVPLKEGPAVALADAADQITLVRLGDGKTLATWTLPGKITAGPALRHGHIVCVVGKNKVIAIDPAQKDAFWQHACVAQVIGLPELDGDHLVVADWSGRVDWLELKPGLPVARSFNLEAHVVPAAAPVALGGRLLLALSDGTLMVVERREKKSRDD